MRRFKLKIVLAFSTRLQRFEFETQRGLNYSLAQGPRSASPLIFTVYVFEHTPFSKYFDGVGAAGQLQFWMAKLIKVKKLF